MDIVQKYLNKQSTQKYVASFKSKKILKTTLIDLVAIAIVVALFVLFTTLFTNNAENLVQGMNSDQLTEYLLTSPEQELTSYLTTVKTLLAGLVIGIIALIFIGIYSYGYSRQKVYKILGLRFTEKKLRAKEWGKWFFLLILYSVFALILGALFLLIKSILLQIIVWAFQDNYVTQVSGQFLNVILLILGLLLFFSFNITFLQSRKMWASIGDAFLLLKQNIKKISVMFVYQVLTLFIINGILIYILQRLFPLNFILLLVVEGIVAIVFISWSRAYYLDTIK